MLRTVWGVCSHQVLEPQNSNFVQPYLADIRVSDS